MGKGKGKMISPRMYYSLNSSKKSSGESRFEREFKREKSHTDKQKERKESAISIMSLNSGVM